MGWVLFCFHSASEHSTCSENPTLYSCSWRPLEYGRLGLRPLQKLRASKGLAGPLIHGFFFFCFCFFFFVCLFVSVDKQTALRICGFHIRRCGGPAMGLEHAQILVSPACPGTSPWRHQGVNLLVRLLLLSTGCWIWRAEPGDSPQTFLQGLRS